MVELEGFCEVFLVVVGRLVCVLKRLGKFFFVFSFFIFGDFRSWKGFYEVFFILIFFFLNCRSVRNVFEF